jgi:hypothetical protein
MDNILSKQVIPTPTILGKPLFTTQYLKKNVMLPVIHLTDPNRQIKLPNPFNM